MGYETRVIIGQKSKSIQEGEAHWFKLISVYDLCKVDLGDLVKTVQGKGASLLARSSLIERAKIFYYDDWGNKVFKDAYGAELIAFDPQLLLETLIQKRSSDAYRRYPPLIALLESMIQEFRGDFQVVLFGH